VYFVDNFGIKRTIQLLPKIFIFGKVFLVLQKNSDMTLIKSISGIRGTIGGKPGEGLSPLDVVKFTSAFGAFIQNNFPGEKVKMVIGRDARISGEMVNRLVVSSLNALGIDVVDLGLSTTPTVEIMVCKLKAKGGIILTASHNPAQWNALKLLNHKGEFINAEEGNQVLQMAEDENFSYSDVYELGSYSQNTTHIQDHIQAVLALKDVDVELIRKANFRIALDCVNSTGGIALPPLLKALGVETVYELYCEPTGHFPHNPEPLPKNLTEIAELVLEKKADLAFVVDPDVDRLAIVCEDGSMFGEEYTLVAVADYILSRKKGSTVSNLSSSRALRDLTQNAGEKYFASAVGEVNVVDMMKQKNAVIGGEGNGGIIFPELHYGRDALVGIALFLTHLAQRKLKCSELRDSYPAYTISKNKIELSPDLDVDNILKNLEIKYKETPHSTIDGLKLDFPDGWVHLRKSNTEPIIRIYSEAQNAARAEELAVLIMDDIKSL